MLKAWYDLIVAALWISSGIIGLACIWKASSGGSCFHGMSARCWHRLCSPAAFTSESEDSKATIRDPRCAEILKRHIQERREVHSAWFARFGTFFISFVSVFSGLVPLYAGLKSIDRKMNPLQDVSLVVMVVTMILFDRFPALQRGRGAVLCHILLMSVFVLVIWPFSRNGILQLMAWRVPIGVVRMLFSLLPLCFRAAVGTNVVFSGILMVCFSQFHDIASHIAIVTEAVVLVSMILFLFLYESQVVASADRGVQELLVHGQHSASSSLLRMVCDALVELDAEHRISGGCAYLSSLLLHGNKGGKLDGESLENYIYPEDIDRFRSSMAVPDFAEDLEPNAFHIRFRDAYGSPVAMELYHVPYSIGGQLRHLVGLKEQVDFAQGPRGLAAATPQGPSCEALDTNRDDEVSSLRSETRFATSAQFVRASTPPVHLERRSTWSVQVDFLATREFPITFSCQTFSHKFGAAERLIDIGLNKESEFIKWLSAMADDVYTGARPPGPMTYGAVVLAHEGTQSCCMATALFLDPATFDCMRRDDYRASVKFYSSLSHRRSTTGSSSCSGQRSASQDDAQQHGRTLVSL